MACSPRKNFAGLDLHYSASIGSYKVDFLVGKLALVLEYDEDHSGYNLAAEEEREKYISRHYTLIRFNEQTSLEDLVNAILRAQIKQVICLYN